MANPISGLCRWPAPSCQNQSSNARKPPAAPRYLLTILISIELVSRVCRTRNNPPKPVRDRHFKNRQVALMMLKFAFISNSFAAIAQAWEDRQRAKILLILGARSFRAFMWMVCLSLPVAAVSLPAMSEEAKLLNVSYDPTRELYSAINDLFTE